MPISCSMHLSRVILRVKSPDSLARFYIKHFGMKASREGETVILGYDGADATIALQQAEAGDDYQHARTDRYWKIGITLPNVDFAQAQLHRTGFTVSDPSQFGDIGYMCHLSDPEGFSIELLQHRFIGNRDTAAGDPNQPLGGGARIGQITLRVTDLQAALAFYRDRLGMRLLSIQPVPAFGFTLYFLAFTDERPPNADLEAVENREWLWMRPYTTLELQHLASDSGPLGFPGNADPGFAGIQISASDHAEQILHDEAGGKVSIAKPIGD